MADVSIAGLSPNEYFDIVNIDRYDILVGTPFMHRFKVILDFENKCVTINGQSILAKIVPGTAAGTDTHRHRLRCPVTAQIPK